MSSKKIKIVFFSLHSITVNIKYWQQLKDKADCHWVTFSKEVNDELKKEGCGNIHFRDIQVPSFRPVFLHKIANRIYSYLNHLTFQNIINTTLDRLSPDVIMSGTTLSLVNYRPSDRKTMKVLVFHSVPYKKYILIPESILFDMVMLPSDYHKGQLIKRFSVDNPEKLRVVGWPRGDDFIASPLSSHERVKVMEKYKLDPKRKNILYAPTWDAFDKNGLFPKNFGPLEEALETFCQSITQMGVNLIIKLHPMALDLILNKKLHSLAERQGVLWLTKNPSGHIDRESQELLLITDILISDVSGIITDYLNLDRPIIYLEPDHGDFFWEEADLPRNWRAGIVVRSLNEVISALQRSLAKPQELHSLRMEIRDKIFYRADGASSQRAAEDILEYYEKKYTGVASV